MATLGRSLPTRRASLVDVPAAAAVLIIALFTPAAHAQSQERASPLTSTEEVSRLAQLPNVGTNEPDAGTPPRDWLYRASQLAHLMGHGADLGSTFDALNRPGFREANPALAWASDKPALLGAAKMGLAAVTLYITHELYRRGHKRLARTFGFVLAGAFVGVAIANGRTVDASGAR